jgi:anti-sigma factor RsiW
MMDTLGCDRAEELFFDYREGQLGERDRRALETHLAACSRCRALLEAVDSVVVALRPAAEMEPAADLAARVAARSWRRELPALGRRAFSGAFGLPWRVQALAAALALAVTATFLFARTEGPRLRERVSQRSVNAGVYLRERGERLIEDLRVLRVVVATAFEGRVDRVNDRVDDYRKLLEQRKRQNTPERKGSSAREGRVRIAHFRTPPETGS